MTGPLTGLLTGLLTGKATKHRAALQIVLLAFGTLAALVLLRSSDGALSGLLGFDASVLVVPVTLGGALATLGRLTLALRGTEFAARVSLWRSDSTAQRALHLIDALPGIHRALTDSGLTALGLGLLTVTDAILIAISDYSWMPDVAWVANYLGAFDGLALWGALIMVPLIAARAVATLRRDVGAIVGLPWAHLAVFGAAYALLGTNGALEAAFGLNGTWPLVGFIIAALASYTASALRRAEAIRPRSASAVEGGLRRLQLWRSRAFAPVVAEAAWPAVAWLAVVALARAAQRTSDSLSIDGPGAVDPSYLEVLHSLDVLGIFVALAPFVLIGYLRAFWPAAARIIGSPARHLALLALAYVALSDRGVLTTAFGVSFSSMLVALIGATMLFYAAATLRKTAVQITANEEAATQRTAATKHTTLQLAATRQASATDDPVTDGHVVDGHVVDGRVVDGRVVDAAAGSQRWVKRQAVNTLGVLSVLATSAALAWLVGATINQLPAASVALLDEPATRDAWEGFLPLAAGLYEARYRLAWLTLITTVLLAPMRTAARFAWIAKIAERWRALLGALVQTAVGALVWLVASDLSVFGHGFLVAGAVIAVGMWSLALSRLIASVVASSNTTLAEIFGWLAASRARAFTLGAATAFYVLLMRPVVYGLVELAGLYEYIALLAVLIAVLMNMVNRLRVVADAPSAAASSWGDWHHHQPSLERRTDPRAAVPDGMRRRLLEVGDWRPLGVYLLALLYRSGASLDTMTDVVGSLRRESATPLAWALVRRKRRESVRMMALERAIDAVGRALADPAPPLAFVNTDDIRSLSAPWIETSAEPDALVVALIVADWQRGTDRSEAAERWFVLVDTSVPFLERLTSSWGRSARLPRTRPERRAFVEEAVGALFADGTKRSDPTPRRLPTGSFAGGAA